MIKLSDLSLTGWLLTLLTIALILVLMIFSGKIWHGILPPGRYPALLLAAPGLVIGIVFFIIGAIVLKIAGFPVTKTAREPEQAEGDKPEGQNS